MIDEGIFYTILNTVGSFTDTELVLFQKEVKLRHVKKNEILLQKGEVAKSIFFSFEGLFYQHKSNAENVLTVIDLHLDNEWILNHASFVKQQPSDSFISAFTDGCVLELSIESIHYLIGRSLAFLQLNKALENAVSRLHFFDNALTPLEKYQYVLNHKPLLIQSFPLKLIASYLKVTPETLSRVREKIVKH